MPVIGVWWVACLIAQPLQPQQQQTSQSLCVGWTDDSDPSHPTHS